MGLFSDYFKTRYDGVPIEVEVSTSKFSFKTSSMEIKYSLIIDNKKVDEVKSSSPFTKFSLRGAIQDEVGSTIPVVAWIKQGIFGTSCKLEVNDEKHKIKKLR